MFLIANLEDPDSFRLIVVHVDEICAASETNNAKYCGGNIGNKSEKMCIVKGCGIARHSKQKSSWDSINYFIHLVSGRYSFVTVKGKNTIVWI